MRNSVTDLSGVHTAHDFGRHDDIVRCRTMSCAV